MKKYLVVLLVLTVFAGSNAMAQEQEKLHGEAKHHRSPDAQTSHNGKKHVAAEEKKAVPATPVAAKPVKTVVPAKPAPNPVAVKHVPKKPTVKAAVVKQPVVTHIPAKVPSAKQLVVKHPAVKQDSLKHNVVKRNASKPTVTKKPSVKKAQVRHFVNKPQPIINQKNVTVNENKPTTEIEIKNGNVLINDSFVFKIKSLKNEDDKITINTTISQVILPKTETKEEDKDEAGERGDKSERPMLGVYTADAPKGGARIESVVPGSPANRIGFREGDIITGVNDKKITYSYDLVKAISKFKAGDRVTITRVHNGEEEIAVVVLSRAVETENERNEEMPEPHHYYKKFYHGRWR